MITGYFGVPGVGKTTSATRIARKELRRIKLGLSRYKHVYTNFYCKGCKQIAYNDLKFYKVYDSLLIFDELTLDADNRKFKDFSDEHRDFFILHRHLGVDIIYFTQDYSKIDAKIRALTQELWYMSRTVVPFFRRWSSAKRIYRSITINEHTGDLIMGYRFCNFFESLFTSNFKLIYRPSWYKFFNSYDESILESRPVFQSRNWSTGDSNLDKLISPFSRFKKGIKDRIKHVKLSMKKRNNGKKF